MNTEKTFLSYSRQGDSDFAMKLARDLRSAGVQIWFDQLDIETGSRWDAAVESALQSATRLIVLLSPTSVASNNVLDEVSYALEEGKRVIPVVVKECAVPLRLRRLHRLDFTRNYDSALRRLISELKSGEATVEAGAPAETSDKKAGQKVAQKAKAVLLAEAASIRSTAKRAGILVLIGFAGVVVFGVVSLFRRNGDTVPESSTPAASAPAASTAAPPVESPPKIIEARKIVPSEPSGDAVAASPGRRATTDTDFGGASGRYTDVRDGRQYRWVRIGNRIWFADNLAYKPAKGFYPADNTKWGDYPDKTGSLNAPFSRIDAPEYVKAYGGLYSWDAARSSCPQGWHLPAKSEWEELIAIHGGAAKAGRKMSAAIGKYSSWGDWNKLATNDFGFAAVPGGRMEVPDRFLNYLGGFASYWSATEASATTAVAVGIQHFTDSAFLTNKDKTFYGLSVRCARD